MTAPARPPRSEAETVEFVVRVFAVAIASAVVISVTALVIYTLTHPEADTEKGFQAVGGLITSVMGAILGHTGTKKAQQSKAKQPQTVKK